MSCLQQAFTILTHVFDHTGLHKNMSETVSMDCQTCRSLRSHSAEAYGLRIMGEVHTYQERLRQQVLCPKCNMELTAGDLPSHIPAQHGVAQNNLRDTPPHPLDEPMNYRASLLRTSCDIYFPVGGCSGRALIQSTLRIHFLHRHVQEALVVLDEDNHPLPCCPN